MKIWSLSALAGLAAISIAAAPASATVINFDDLTVGTTVDNAYAGVSFQAGDWIVQTGFGPTSKPNFAYSGSGTGSVNFLSGISSLSFTYGAFTASTLNVYSGLNGTGTLLNSFGLAAGFTSAFAPVSLNFSGTAQSVVLSGGASQFGWDDLSFGAVPEPASWAMMMVGFGIVGAAMRQRSKLSVKAAFQA